MSDPPLRSPACRRDGPLFACLMPFVAIVAGLWALLTPGIVWFQGLGGLLEASLAALVCLISGITALVATSVLGTRQHPLAGVLLATALRMLPALIVCVLLSTADGGGQFLGFVGYLLVFYLVTLAIETYLSVKLVERRPLCSGSELS